MAGAGADPFTGGSCTFSTSEVIFVCGGSPLHGGGTMYGSVYVTSDDTVDVLDREVLLEHEGDHSDQFAILGEVPFAVDYFVVGEGVTFVRDNAAPLSGPHCNPMETLAGLEGGYYTNKCQP